MPTLTVPAWLPVLALTVTTITCCHAGPLPDGLYPIIAGGEGATVQRADDHTSVTLGERIPLRFSDPRLVSVTNDNSAFRFSVATNAMPEGHGLGPCALVVAGVCIPVSIHWDDDSATLVGMVARQEIAKMLADALEIAPTLREHPGHRLVVSMRPEKPAYAPNEPVTLVMTIKNVGDAPIRFMDGGRQRGPRNNQFAFIAHRNHGFGRAVPDTGDPTNFGGIATYQTVQPGESFQKSADLSKWFTFDAPDSYHVTAMYQLTLQDEAAAPLWDEFATATCTVRIVDAAFKD